MSRVRAKIAFSLIVILITSIQVPWQAAAVADPVLTAPSLIDFSSSTWAAGSFGIDGYSVEADAGTTILAAISLSNAPAGDSLTITANSNLATTYPYQSSNFSRFTEIAFTGTKANINLALASSSFKYVSATGAKNNLAKIKVMVTENVPGVAYFAKDDHFYKVGHYMSAAGNSLVNNRDSGYFCGTGANSAYGSAADRAAYITSYADIETLTVVNVGDSRCTWGEANRLARSSTLKGRPGYLTNITSADENEFLRVKLQGALNSWIGGTDGANDGNHSNIEGTGFTYTSNSNLSTTYAGGTEGLWHFYDGPEKGQIFWRYLGGYSGMSAPNYPIDTHAKWQSYRNTWEKTGHNVNGGNTNISQTGKNDLVGYTSWSSPSEPNNGSSSFTFTDSAGQTTTGQQGEDNIVFNWVSANGNWNDLHGSEPTVPYYGYIIEYGDSTAFTGVSKLESGVGFPLTATINKQDGGSTSTLATTIGGSISNLATPTRTGYYFNGWFTATSGGTAITFPYTHAQTSNFTLYAQWTQLSYSITYYDSNTASGSGADGGNAPASQSGSNVDTVTLNTNTLSLSNHIFSGWATSNGSTTVVYNNLATVTITPSLTLSLYPVWIRTYTITASADVNGTISASGTTTVNSGSNQSYTFSPVSGYKISDVLVNGISQGAITSYTFTNVVANHTISVVFEKISIATSAPQKSAEQIAAEAAAQKIADEKAAEVLAVQQKALSDNAEADKAFKTLQDQLATLLSTGVFPKLPTDTKAPTTTKSPTTGTTKSPTTATTDSSKSGVTVPDGTVLITPTQIATLDIAQSGSGASANIAISQLKSGQRVRVTVISKADLNTKVVDLNSTEITTITPGPIKPSPAVNPTLIDIKPAPKTNAAAPNKADISVSGVKKNQRVRVTVKSK
jgi:uncharacterized repeat protein (TIGR02543 family)